jgi:hypothetical protein
MEIFSDWEEMLELLAKHKVRYLIIGGVAFTFHAKPRHTRDLDLWIDPSPANVRRANAALTEFGSHLLLNATKADQIVQLGVEPDRIDFFLSMEGETFKTAWRKRVEELFGRAKANWIDIDTLIRIKSRINDPRHQEDVRLLREVKKRHSKMA